MLIYTVWATRKSDPGEPELVTAWDEFSVDANPEGYDEDCEKSLASWGDDLLNHRTVMLTVPDKAIFDAFKALEVEAEVSGG